MNKNEEELPECGFLCAPYVKEKKFTCLWYDSSYFGDQIWDNIYICEVAMILKKKKFNIQE